MIKKQSPAISVDKSVFESLGKQDFFKSGIALRDGGNDETFLDFVRRHEEIGFKEASPSLILSLNAHIWGGIFSLLLFGTEHQKSTYLKNLIAGELIGGHAITEKEAGSNISGIHGSFEERSSGYILNAHKRYITNAPIADYLVVYLKDQSGISAFIVNSADAGYNVVETYSNDSFSECPTGEIVLEDCYVPKSRMLGKKGSGAYILQKVLELERSLIFAGLNGVMDYQLQKVKKFAVKRVIAQKRLSSYQAISHKIADMFFRLESSKCLVSECARSIDAGNRITLKSATIKSLASQYFLDNSLDSIHILGSLGLEDNQLTSFVDDAIASRILGGTTEIQKNIASALLGL